jgi:hypothetical protein
MYPHERSLVARMKDKPFALIGVNSDKDLEKLKARMAEEKITWPSFHDGSTSGPIASQWNVSAWPTIYVLDKSGVIRAKDVRGEELDSWVDKLLAEPSSSTSTAH